jgi:hypothetical protein
MPLSTDMSLMTISPTSTFAYKEEQQPPFLPLPLLVQYPELRECRVLGVWVLARRKENGVVGSSAKNGKKECEVRQVLLIKASQKLRRKMDGATGVLASAIDFLKKLR